MTTKSFKDRLIEAGTARPDTENSINSDQYDPVSDLYELFPTPVSLSQLDTLLAYVNVYKLQLDEDIRESQSNYNSFVFDREDGQDVLASADEKLDDLITELNETKISAENTGTTINQMTASIKTLDNAKKNLTLTMTILKRLQMLITAYENLETFLSDSSNPVKDYLQIKQLFSVVVELMQHFQSYKSIDEINTLNKKISSLKNRIIDEIFADFELEYQEELHNPQLVDACELLDMLGQPYRDKLMNWYTITTLKEITQIFKSTEEAGSLDNLKRRFMFFRQVLENFESRHALMFPASWNMSQALTRNFCEITRKDLKEVTEKETRFTGSKVDVNLLLSSLGETLEFESFLDKKFKQSFDGMISDVFEPYLNIWIDHQGTVINSKFIEFINPSNMLKKSGVEAGGSTVNVLESAADLFRLYRQILSQLSKLSQGESLVRLSTVFSNFLLKYRETVLIPLVPDPKSLSSGTEAEQNEGMELICLVLNTADYCSVTVSQLEERFVSLVHPSELAQRIDFEKSRTVYLNLINNCINLLFVKVENDLQLSWREMVNFNWRAHNEVTSESRYMESVKAAVKEDCAAIFPNFNRVLYIRNYLDKLVELVLSEFWLNTVKLRPITEIMAEQLVFDLQSLKTFLLDLPTLSPEPIKITSSSSFSKNIGTKVLNINTILKILMVKTSPMSDFIASYFTIVADSNFSNFMKVLKLKGLLSNEASYEKERFRYVDQFKTQLRQYETMEETLPESNAFLENLKLENVTAGVVSSPNLALSGFFNSPNSNFKIDKQSLLSTRDNFEKNIAKTFSMNDNKIDIGENLKSFGKFFKKN
ncbi:hypothetical protein OGAPHI_005013 [Ogataea philodendri]|uniref:Vps53 N-terminal domain-containing protein n=1 Tax=Ogataea philodendri TaxID=1378263 RepID=A0A9P8P2I5_9ASCO|nr:uncharacterized protein OGAPHI_005013 [Ogataea philodendri]KAH3663612.1 hypothetical protein OGAPHI_005013 [Ogataea philodendri]